MTDLLAEALHDALASYPNACMPGTELDWCADHLRAALRERGVYLVTVEGLARALCRRDDTPPGLGLDDMPDEVRASYLYNAEVILAALEDGA